MQETWRWFGPDDPVTLAHVRQAGARGVVTALHHLNQGGAWPAEEVERRQREIAAAGLVWSVVESINVAEDIKTRSGEWQARIADYKQSIRTVARAGIRTICYNFMAVTDWTRTELAWPLPSGGYALRFDAVDLAAYDLFVLKRRDAEADHAPAVAAKAAERIHSLSESDIGKLEAVLIDWLPARDVVYGRDGFRRLLDVYAEIPKAQMQDNLIAFLREVVPVAAEEGARLCIHPDDPAFAIFGLPRVLSTAADVRAIFNAIPEQASGLTLCTGAFGSNPDNDLPAMAKEFAPRVHFAHLRNVRREPDSSFFEAEHLDGDVDMVSVVSALMDEEARRRAEGQADHEIPMRSDHGHLLIDDIGKKVNPGYSCIGRLKGLAELRGVTRAVAAFRAGRVV